MSKRSVAGLRAPRAIGKISPWRSTMPGRMAARRIGGIRKALFGLRFDTMPKHGIQRLTSGEFPPNLGVVLWAKPISGGVTASTEMLTAKRHAGVHTPVIACKMIIANQQMAYAA
jgi:hypothetical protein